MSNKNEHLKTNAHEYIKSFITYDELSRMEYVYEARANAKHGEPCMRTQYTYDSTSTRIVKMLEVETTWNSSYDI